jgi:hypothetical protein
MIHEGAREMPRYFFNVRNGAGDLVDRDGTEFPDVLTARNYARDMPRELMLRNEPKKRHWHVVVCDTDGNELFDVPFISIDESLSHLNPETRRLIEVMCDKRMALAQAMFETRMNVLRVRATVARSRAKPYVAAERGHAIDDKVRRKA